VKWVKPPARAKAEQNAEQAANAVKSMVGPTPAQVAEMVKALATLSQALVKAGPALWSMIGSALFLLIATLAAGVFSGDGGTGGNATDDLDTNISTPAGNALAPREHVRPGDENLNVSAYK